MVQKGALKIATNAELIIKPRKKPKLSFSELWDYRELFYFFVWRDVKVRYKQTYVGAAWAIIQPFVTMIVFTLFFNKVAKIDSGSAVPYAIFSYTGLLFWNYFSGTISTVSNSLVGNSGVITKIYFPRIIIPISSILLGVVDLFFAAIMFVILMIYFKIAPSAAGILMLFPMLLLTMAVSFGGGIFFAALNVRFRDVKGGVGFLVQILLFLTPIIYPITKVPVRFRELVYLNPMTAVVTTMRATLIHSGAIDWTGLAISTVTAILSVIIGVLYFRSVERNFADII